MSVTGVRQLRPDEVAAFRKHYAAKQRYRCPLCGGTLASGTPALDHNHKNGLVRSTLCQSCNVSEGKVLAGLLFRTPKGNLAYSKPAAWLRKLADYWDYHEANPSTLVHPTFDLAKGKQKPVKRAAKTVKKIVRKVKTK